ncbi:MAG: serine hydrolase [Phenylobacterium sp.]|nr:MAG: serine hydrolase [Phenylobacterium sp.]
MPPRRPPWLVVLPSRSNAGLILRPSSGGVMRLLFILLFLLPLAGAAAAQPGPAPARQIAETRGDALLAGFTRDKPGLAVLVARGGQVIYERDLGAADLEHAAPVTPATRFHIASVSKQFTAFAILQLAQAGKVDLDADIRRYLPELPDYGERITVSDLVHHTSGLRDQWELEILSGTAIDSAIRHKAILAMAASQKGLNFAPGTDFRYCNTGYSLLAEIVARTSGVSFKQYMREHVFGPLGMNDTLVYDDAADLLPNRAMSYSVGPAGVVRLARLNYSNYGATSVHTTTRDLLKWSRELLHPAVFDPALVRAAEQPGRLRDGRPLNYGFGMAVLPVGGHPALTHSGADAGYRSLIASFPAEDATIVVLSSGAADVGKIGDDLAEAFLGPVPPPATVAADPARIVRLAGYYVNDWTPGFELRPDNGKLYFQLGLLRREVSFLPDGRFYVFSPLGTYRLRPDGTIEEHIALSGLTVLHRPAQRVTPSAAELASLAGAYHSDELDVTYRLAVRGAAVVLSSLRSDPIPFFAADADHFENPQARLTVLRDASGKVTGLTIATGRIKGLVFARTP